MLVIRQGLGLTAIFLTLGLTGALLPGRFVAALLFGVGPTDVATVLVVSILLLGVGLLARSLPARRPARSTRWWRCAPIRRDRRRCD